MLPACWRTTVPLALVLSHLAGCARSGAPLATAPMMDAVRCAQAVVQRYGFEVRDPGPITPTSPQYGDDQYGFEARRSSPLETEILVVTVEGAAGPQAAVVHVRPLGFLQRPSYSGTCHWSLPMPRG